jgi:hypothetical protein
MHFEHAHLNQRNQTRQIFNHHVLFAFALLGNVDALDRLGHRSCEVLLVKAFAGVAFRATHQGERSIDDIRQHPVGDTFIVFG